MNEGLSRFEDGPSLFFADMDTRRAHILYTIDMSRKSADRNCLLSMDGVSGGTTFLKSRLFEARRIYMKKAKLLLAMLAVPLVLGITSATLLAEGEKEETTDSDIAIDETHFPDKLFRKFVKDFDLNNDGILSAEEREQVDYINCEQRNIASLEGIEYFPNLDWLCCDKNRLNELDISKNTKLMQLSCSYNHIKTLDCSNNKELEGLSCWGNVLYDEEKDEYTVKGELTSVNVSGCVVLNNIRIPGNQVNDLRFDNTPALMLLDCEFNKLETLDLSHSSALVTLDCTYNSLSELDISKLSDLKDLYCYGNKLSKLDVSHNSFLRVLECGGNNISSLDVSKCMALESFGCSGNQLKTLDLSKNQNIVICYTDHNKLEKLDIGHTRIAEVYNENLLEDEGTFYSFYYYSEDLESWDFYGLSFDKTTELICKKTGQNICKIDKKTFPDDEFRKYVIQFDQNKDGYFNASEIAAVSTMDLYEMPIESVKGIEYFTGMAIFICTDTPLSDIDFGKLDGLREIYIENRESQVLESVNVSGCPNLKVLRCGAEKVRNLDLSQNTKLVDVALSISVEKLDFSGMKDLQKLDISDDKLITLDISDCPSLSTLYVSSTAMTTMNVSQSNNISEMSLYCENLTSLDISKCTELVSLIFASSVVERLDLSHQSKLMELSCRLPKLTSLNVSNNPLLQSLEITCPKVTSIDLDRNTELTFFSVSEGLQQVDLSKNAKLQRLWLSDCPIEQINVTACKDLVEITCDKCKLTRLDVSKNLKLETLWCDETPLTELPDISKNTKLHSLALYGVKTNTIKLSHLQELSVLKLNKMDIAALDLSNNTKLIYIDLSDNLLTELDLSFCGTLNYVDLRLNLFKEKPKYSCGGQDYFEPQKTSVPSFETFVERLYTIALNRNSDPEGKAFWVKQVVEEGKTGADCARFFLLDAPEFMNRNLSTEDFVETLYKTFFDRESDAAGKTGWVSAIKNGQKTRADVVNDFIESTEWCDVCAAYGVRSGAKYHKATKASQNAIDFATRLYTCCLGRAAEEGGLKYWSLALTNLEQTGAAAAKLFFESEEFVGLKTSDTEYIRRLYTTFMGREAVGVEIDYWVGEIADGRQTRHSTLAFFAQSDEFTKICKQYGIERGSI